LIVESKAVAACFVGLAVSMQKKPHTKVAKAAKLKAEKAIQIVHSPVGELFF
jgi:hypothetical protein